MPLVGHNGSATHPYERTAVTQPESFDPTWIPIEFDPCEQRMRGVAFHGDTPFDVPYLSEITEGFYQGGCKNGLVLPENIEHLVSLYPWEQYNVTHDLDSRLEVRMYDSVDNGPDMVEVERIADWVNACRRQGPTLVHCQAGLNRSGLIAAIALLRDGEDRTPREAIDLLRSSRSTAVLCNPAFENMVMGYR